MGSPLEEDGEGGEALWEGDGGLEAEPEGELAVYEEEAEAEAE